MCAPIYVQRVICVPVYAAEENTKTEYFHHLKRKYVLTYKESTDTDAHEEANRTRDDGMQEQLCSDKEGHGQKKRKCVKSRFKKTQS